MFTLSRGEKKKNTFFLPPHLPSRARLAELLSVQIYTRNQKRAFFFLSHISAQSFLSKIKVFHGLLSFTVTAVLVITNKNIALNIDVDTSDSFPETTTTEILTTTTTTTTKDQYSLCNCDDHCSKNQMIESKNNASLAQENDDLKEIFHEDADNDGNRTICAVNRDLVDRSFLSVCHMMCYNRCTIYRAGTSFFNNILVNHIVARRERQFFIFYYS